MRGLFLQSRTEEIERGLIYMGKRYGRNQKRKAREQIAMLSHENKAASERITLLRNKDWANQEAVKDTIRVLGEYFCTLPEPVDIDVRHALDVINICNQGMELGCDQGRNAGAISEILSLPIMRIGIHVDELRRATVARVFIRGSAIAELAISDRAIKIMPVDMLSKKIAKELADSIAEQLKALR